MHSAVFVAGLCAFVSITVIVIGALAAAGLLVYCEKVVGHGN